MGRNADADDRIRTDGLADGGDDFANKPEAFFLRSAELVVAAIDVGTQELGELQAMAGSQFNPVEPRLYHPPRRISVGFDEHPHVFRGHRPGHGVEAVIGNRGRSIGDTQQPLISTGEPPTIGNLAEYLAAVSMDGIRAFSKTGNARIPAGVDAVGLKGSFTSRTGGFHDDQPGATGGSGLMVGRYLFGWAPIPRHHVLWGVNKCANDISSLLST